MQTVTPGETFALTGTLVAGDVLTADAGNALQPLGAVVAVRAHGVNDGTIDLLGADPAGDGAVYGATLAVSGLLTNAGTISVGASIGGSGAATYGALVDVTGVLVNSGAINVAPASESGGFSGHGGTLQIAQSGVLDNTGTILTATSYGYAHTSNFLAGTLSDAGQLNNSGTLDVGTGGNTYGYRSLGALLTIAQSGILANHAVIDIAATLVDGGVLTNSGTINVETAITFSQENPPQFGLLDITGVLENSGIITVQSYHYDGYFLTLPGQMTNTGTVLNAGQIIVQGGPVPSPYGYPGGDHGGTLANAGLMVNTGSIRVGAGREVYGFAGPRGVLLNSGTLVNAGLLDDRGSTTDSGTLINDRQIDIAGGGGDLATGTLLVTGTLINDGKISGGGTLDNQAVIDASTTASIAANLVNNGTVEVSSGGAMTVSSGVSGTGLFEIGARSSLTLGGGVAAGQSVTFLGDHTSLALGDTAAFAGTLDALGVGTTLDFLGLDVTGASETSTALMLDLAGGGALYLALASPWLNVDLRLSSDGSGGTDLAVLPSGSTAASDSPPAIVGLASTPTDFHLS
jgi:hypothetical protein